MKKKLVRILLNSEKEVMKKWIVMLLFQGIWLLFPISTTAQHSWTVEISGGGAYSLKSPLTLRQKGYEDLEFDAEYATHSFQPPLYYSLRLARWKENRGWELELVHLKLQLTNLPAEVQHFEISHGYNLVTLNRVWLINNFILRAGAGIVVAHPENTVREKSLDEHRGILGTGHYLAGPTVQAAIGKTFSFSQRVFLSVEGKVTGSYATIPIVDGDAIVPAVALHGILGLGYVF
jgi:hypothetical protein